MAEAAGAGGSSILKQCVQCQVRTRRRKPRMQPSNPANASEGRDAIALSMRLVDAAVSLSALLWT